MIDEKINFETLRAAIEALSIDVPIYSAILIVGGGIQITTRNGTQTWKPPAAAKKTTTTPRKPRRKRTTTEAK